MQPIEALEHIISESGVPVSTVAAGIGRSRQSLYNMFRDKADYRISTLAQIADQVGYEVVLRGPEGEIVIDAPGGQE